ncbi:MAG TPA: ATP-binding protein [Longimicrobiales bacterium]|nr:ATP-binding protein [Longimicrobiales bacterium]
MADQTVSLVTDVAFRLLVESVQDYAIFMLDKGGHIISWNLGAERAKGYTAAEIIGKHISVFYTEPDLVRNHPAFELDYALKHGRYEEEGWRLRKDGTRFWASVVITAVFDEQRRHIGFGKVTRDLTERRARQQRELQLEQKRIAAEASNKAKTEFLTAMSHELRTPLNAIIGYVDLLDAGVHGELNPAQRDTLVRVRRSSKLLLALINDVLNIARIEAGQLIYEVRAVSVRDLLSDVEALMTPQYKQAGIGLIFDPPPEHEVQADPERAQQILLNLLGNALKFTPTGGRVRVSSYSDPRFVYLVVEDSGRGIPPEKHEVIFDPFVQIDRHRTEESVQGVGLGLSISRQLARGMHGDITIDSPPGQGATFTVSLPRV